MLSDLYHPPFVTSALDRVDEMTSLREMQVTLAIIDRRSPAYIPDEALVRLLRRLRLDPDPAMEGVVFETLSARIFAWTRWQFSGLDECDRDDIAQGVAIAVLEAIRRTTKVDFWEITFDINKKRAAADVYQDQFKRHEREEEVDPGVLAEAGNDEGSTAAEMTERTHRLAVGRRFLSDDEFEVFEILVRLGLPVASKKASSDIVRRTGKAEGTVREIVTRIKRKMAIAIEEQSR